MNKFSESLPSAIFWVAVCLFIWVEHTQYLAGHETTIFQHKTDTEKRILEAQVRNIEIEATQPKDCK